MITAMEGTLPEQRSAPVQPTERCYGLGELIYAHRIYMGLSQRGMARRLKFDRRDYQRIEQGRNECPVGFLTKVTDLVDLFDSVTDSLIDAARKNGDSLTIQVSDDPGHEWERLVAGRAAVLGAVANAPVKIKLTTMAPEVQR